MLRRTFLKAVIAATGAAAAAKLLPAHTKGAEPIQIGHAYMVKDTGEVVRQSKTPVWVMHTDWKQRLLAGGIVQIQSFSFESLPTATYSAVQVEADGFTPMLLPLASKRVVWRGDAATIVFE